MFCKPICEMCGSDSMQKHSTRSCRKSVDGGKGMLGFWTTAGLVFVVLFAAEPLIIGLFWLFGVYTIVNERTCHVYVLFGRVIGILDRPGLSLLWFKLGPAALIVNWLGRRHVLDLR